MEVQIYRRWNKEHPLVGQHGNLREENGNFIFSTIEAERQYPGSTITETYIRYTWSEYIQSQRTDAVSFYPGLYAICLQ